jgi:hypothetical protein
MAARFFGALDTYNNYVKIKPPIGRDYKIARDFKPDFNRKLACWEAFD